MLQRARRGGIRPISIGRALLAKLDAQFDDLKLGDALKPKYVITRHPEDASEMSAFETALLDELHQAVTHHAKIEGYTLTGEVEIEFAIDAMVKRGTFTVAPPEHPTPEATPTAARPRTNIEPTIAAAKTADALIVLASGERIALTDELSIVGRQSDCQIVIDDHNVSRTHAEIRRTTAGWTVTDRGSTNGTTVNGEKIVAGRLLVHGDTIAFGSTPVRFENS